MADDNTEITINPARRSGDPCIAGSRIPVDAVVAMVWCDGVEAAMDSWDFTRGQVLVACWFVAAYNAESLRGGVDRPYRVAHGKWRSRWGEWAVSVSMALWESHRGDARYNEIADPPMRHEESA